MNGRVRGKPGASHSGFPYAWRRIIRRPTRPTGLNLFLGTVVFDLAQGRSFPGATYTGEGFTRPLQVFTVPLEISSHPPQRRSLQRKSILGGLTRLDISSSHSGCCWSLGQQAALGFRRRNAATLAVRTGRWQSPATTATPRRLGGPSRRFPSSITTKQNIRCGACTKACNAYSAM